MKKDMLAMSCAFTDTVPAPTNVAHARAAMIGFMDDFLHRLILKTPR
jgi:hypothetical protein